MSFLAYQQSHATIVLVDGWIVTMQSVFFHPLLEGEISLASIIPRLCDVDQLTCHQCFHCTIQKEHEIIDTFHCLSKIVKEKFAHVDTA